LSFEIPATAKGDGKLFHIVGKGIIWSVLDSLPLKNEWLEDLSDEAEKGTNAGLIFRIAREYQHYEKRDDRRNPTFKLIVYAALLVKHDQFWEERIMWGIGRVRSMKPDWSFTPNHMPENWFGAENGRGKDVADRLNEAFRNGRHNR
jgi:hypothetical protein